MEESFQPRIRAVPSDRQIASCSPRRVKSNPAVLGDWIQIGPNYVLERNVFVSQRNRRALLHADNFRGRSRTLGADPEELEECIPLRRQKSMTSRELAMQGKYLIRDAIASGSYGTVLRAEKQTYGPDVAVKIIPKNILISTAEQQSVIRECMIHESLDHPHIVRMIEKFEDEEAFYLILERIEAPTLTSCLRGRIATEDLQEIVQQLMRALGYLHAKGVIHHDIKPCNVLWNPDEKILKLCDFGASRVFNLSQPFVPFDGIYGTTGYLAPELLCQTPTYGTAIDIWSAGITIFEIVFQYQPFYPPSSCIDTPVEFPNDPVSNELKHLIQSMLHPNPLERISALDILLHPWLSE